MGRGFLESGLVGRGFLESGLVGRGHVEGGSLGGGFLNWERLGGRKRFGLGGRLRLKFSPGLGVRLSPGLFSGPGLFPGGCGLLLRRRLGGSVRYLPRLSRRTGLGVGRRRLLPLISPGVGHLLRP